jgi:hypothetical protein
MSRPVVNPGTLLWSGEHWIDYLREPGAAQNSAMVSLYRTVYSAAGEGVTAFVGIPGEGGLAAIYSDNRAVTDVLLELMIRPRPDHPFNRPLPLVDAELSRGGDIRSAPSWTIRGGSATIVATWSGLDGPVVTEGPAGTFTDEHDFFTVLVFAARATVSLNGRQILGEPYPIMDWDRSIGGERSSCVFAFAETMTLASRA